MTSDQKTVAIAAASGVAAMIVAAATIYLLWRGSRTVLGGPGGEIPPGDSTVPDTHGPRHSFRIAMFAG